MSMKRWMDKLAVSSEPGLTNAQLMLINKDLRPVEPERRQWRWYNFIAFWIADGLNISTWMIASSMIVDGLSWWQSWICVWIGYSIAASLVVVTGRIGAVYHISFPVACRSSFGIWGSFWPVLNRAAMAVIWYGVQAYIGGNCVTLMISAIWPSYANLKNTMPASAGVETKDFVSFFIFWLLSLPAIWFPVHKIRHLFTVKAYFSPICAIAFFGWAIGRAKGIGPIVHQPSKLEGSALAWAIVKAIISCLGNFATMIVNNPDFSRFATKPKDALWSQLLTIPFGFAIASFIGIIVSSSSTVLFGDTIWNPLDLLGQFLEGASSAERFGIFIISTGFALAQLGTNIAANSISAGTDLTALFPRYINIRHGGYICAAVGLAMCPWNLSSSSNKFTTYLSAYSLFLSSIAGVMVSDYYFVKKGYLELKELYSPRKGSPYYYTFGISIHAYTAYLSGIVINIVGFVGAVGVDVPIGATYIYNVNYFAGFLVSAGVYYLLTRIMPIPATSEKWNEIDYDVTDMSITYGQEVSIDDDSPDGNLEESDPKGLRTST